MFKFALPGSYHLIAMMLSALLIIMKSYFLTDPFSKLRKIFFKGNRIPFDGVPFVIIGTKIFDCQHGPDRKKTEKVKFCKQKVKKYYNTSQFKP